MSPALVRRAGQVLGGLAGAAAMIAGVTVVSRLLGFARWGVQAHALGSGAIGGAYNAANTLPNVLFEVAAGGALAGAIVPVLVGPIAARDRRTVDATASATLGWTLLVLVPLGLLLAAVSGLVGPLLLRDPDPSQVALVQFFVLVFAVQVPIYGTTVLLYGVLQAHRKFFWPAFAPILSSVVVIVAYLVYGSLAHGEQDDSGALEPGALSWLAWGTTAGVAAMCFPMLVPVRRLGVRLRPTLRFPDGVGRRVRSLAFAGVGAVLAQQLSVLVTMKVAFARGDEGTYSVFLWTQAVYLLPYAVLVVPLATATFPRMASRASEGDRAGFAHLASRTTRAVLAAAAIGAAALAAAAPAVADLFLKLNQGRSPELVAAMAPTLSWMLPGLLGFAVVFHGSRSLYALERGRLAVASTAVGWVGAALAAIALGAWLVPSAPDAPSTLVLLGGASSIGMLLGGVATLVALRRAAGPRSLDGLLRTVFVLVAAGVLGAAIGRWVTDSVLSLSGHGWASAIGAGAGGGVLAALVVAAALLALDGGTVRDLVRVDQRPAQPTWRDSPVRRDDRSSDLG
ncbi:murein biosynthesis integral membrane protein MurJ [Cellulomonas soli]|uniref:Membrane protein n=1 Tax=Cellulomonas soli TaxID=931535 RepID=A0A512PH58_9CELL|nr:lipid II flippase MurJ [Cellulomonas soli]NYI60899.1 putative peptidoglycan lipid II flippase [Cellulomonas soli]GEP70517.1 membrane protein [Cellulomonas soli]